MSKTAISFKQRLGYKIQRANRFIHFKNFHQLVIVSLKSWDEKDFVGENEAEQPYCRLAKLKQRTLFKNDNIGHIL